LNICKHLPSVNTNPVNLFGCTYLSKTQITQTAIFSGIQQTDTCFYDPQAASSISGVVLAEGVVQMVLSPESQKATTGQGLASHG